MKSLMVLALTGLSLGVVPPQSARALLTPSQHTLADHRVAAVRTITQSGTVVLIRARGSRSLITLRIGSGQLVDITTGRWQRILTRDGRNLSIAQVRPGDRLVVRGTSKPSAGYPQIRDMSQRVVDVKGIVASALDPQNGPLQVTLGRSRSVIADLGRQTHFTDASKETSSLSQIEDADLVRLHGVLDEQLGEMTQTDSIARLGPFRCPKSQTAASCRRRA